MTAENQLCSQLLMLRPHHFYSNPETRATNAFQQAVENPFNKAVLEFDEFVRRLRSKNISVEVVEADDPRTPDAVFPNNWLSTHGSEGLCTYSLFAKNRRLERKPEIVKFVSDKFGFSRVTDCSSWENEDLFLEGTGSLVLDRTNKKAYCCLSARSQVAALNRWCEAFGYKSVSFEATDRAGTPIYHTNVMLSVGEDVAVICLESIRSGADRQKVLGELHADRKEVLEISLTQMENFCGNLLQVCDSIGQRYWILSDRALQNLDTKQKSLLTRNSFLLSADLTTIENLGGGSARCMICEIFPPL